MRKIEDIGGEDEKMRRIEDIGGEHKKKRRYRRRTWEE